ncbi:hypothetical protein DAEQUDRAFT_768294 [Daedalea quercina L-15889]|uniref:Uncharacterized protein n=1 Tax=Daedalea quercina L-15889 TaxID=1314783 RepID=A0A165MUS3_9APHY|nr:hypothetical protein DAEQUDRAFT_768294 [Daedalea quercina L-15889]
MPLSQHGPYRAATLAHCLVLSAFVAQCKANSDTTDFSPSMPNADTDMAVIIIAVLAAAFAILYLYRGWLMARRRARAGRMSVSQTREATLPTIQTPHVRSNARLPPSQPSYLGENLAVPTIGRSQEPPPPYRGKQPLGGETVITMNAPPTETETPPAYTAPALTSLPPAYIRDNQRAQFQFHM